MHPLILEGCALARRLLCTAAHVGGVLGMLMAATGPAVARSSGRSSAAGCPVHATALVERFTGADCTRCWTAPDSRADPVDRSVWPLDWITPAGGDAPMATGALPESTDRLARLGRFLPARLQVQPAAFDTITPLAPAPRGGTTRTLAIRSGLPYNGYLGVQLHVAGTWPAGDTAWIALVELLPAGAGGSPVERHLVRALLGPVALPGPSNPVGQSAFAPLYAMRWPYEAHAQRLMATAWIEGQDGRILQITSDRCGDPH